MARLDVGTKIAASGMGAGEVTGFSERGFPQVNGVTVGWCRLECGALFDPYGVVEEEERPLMSGNSK